MPRTGRPTKIDQVARTRPDGSTVTVAQQLTERVTLGLDLQTACDSSGISRSTLHKWRLEGARHRARHAQGHRLTPAQQRLADFVDDLERAEADRELGRLAIIDRASRPTTVTKTTVKIERVPDQREPDGYREVEVERTTTTEQRLGSWQAAAWFLERAHAAKYARRVELTGAGGEPLVPTEERARNLADSARAYLLGVADTTTTEPKELTP